MTPCPKSRKNDKPLNSLNRFDELRVKVKEKWSPTVWCDLCGETQEGFGGLIFSPPDQDMEVAKYHVCFDCWPHVRGLIFYAKNKRGK